MSEEKQFTLELRITRNEFGWWCEHLNSPNEVLEGYGETLADAVIHAMKIIKTKKISLEPLEWKLPVEPGALSHYNLLQSFDKRANQDDKS